MRAPRSICAAGFTLASACAGFAGTEPAAETPGGPVDPASPFVSAPAGRERGPNDPVFLFDLTRRQRSSALRMLTRDETARAVANLTGVQPDLTEFPEDERLFNLTNDGLSGGVHDGQHVMRLMSMANDVALRIDPDVVVQCDAGGCSPDEIKRFLVHAFVKPVSDEQAAPYVDLYQRVVAANDATLAKRALVQSVLVSPLFLYRTELGGGAGLLTPHELAAKLAYFLWGGPPDTPLEQAAADGTLMKASVYQAQVERMLVDPKASPQIKHVLFEWLGLDHFNLVTKQPATKVPATLQGSMEKEVALLIENLTVGERKPLRVLLSSPETWVDQSLAQLYGRTDVKGAAFQKVSLDGTERRGLLTTALVLSAHGKESGRSPIQRGHFLVSELMCRTFPPSAGLAAMQLPAGDETLTLRQRFEPLETADVCSNCHRTLNAGFAFDLFDEVGARFPESVVSSDEARGAFDLPPYDVLKFSSTVEAAEAFAAHPAVRECAVTQLYRYAQGRVADDRDAGTLRQLVQWFGKDGEDVVALMKSIVGSRAFRSATAR